MSARAPGRLDVVRAFVNTVDFASGDDALGTPDGLAGWLAAHGLGDAVAQPADVGRAAALREALRDLLLAHHGDHRPDPRSAGVVDDAARRARLGVRFDAGGSAAPRPEAGGVDGALGALLTIVAAAQADGTWERLKVCPWDTCRWAFYDRSRNRAGVWCSMAVCGNRAKAAALRARRATA
jgi:predicted RNA-binding Zn ribbon-like protein